MKEDTQGGQFIKILLIEDERLLADSQRFYRTDTARSRDGSYGLGRSIARELFLSMGGKYGHRVRITSILSLSACRNEANFRKEQNFCNRSHGLWCGRVLLWGRLVLCEKQQKSKL